MPGLPARRTALRALTAVLTDRLPLDAALAGELGALAEPRDRAFAHALAGAALRRRGQIEAVLAGFIERPLPKSAAEARAILLVLGAELLVLGGAPHAAVATAVALAGAGRARSFKGLVNAVGRRIAERRDELLEGADIARLCTPDWLWSRWSAAYGEGTARAIAEAHLEPPPLDITPRRPDDPLAFAEGAELLPTGSVRLARPGPVPSLPGFSEGIWWVQDAAAALPARLLGPRPGERILDLCAAPGGKTLQLAAAGAEVTAVDISPERLEGLAENLARTGLSARIVAADAAEFVPDEAPDRILLDAPCLATGTIRRHPDIAWSKREADLGPLRAMQARLLEAAGRVLAPGGTLVYAVCSLEPEEGPAQIAAFLRMGGFSRVPVAPDEVPGLAEALTPEGDLRTLPCHWRERGGLDGFFAARLRKAP
ncbi:MAG: methyltransferase domain-containing protein [Alphaproteobacteria bacterium]|nr:methyltransferase domain-containing protein [Alphaproteobacteria bacterium]